MSAHSILTATDFSSFHLLHVRQQTRQLVLRFNPIRSFLCSGGTAARAPSIFGFRVQKGRLFHHIYQSTLKSENSETPDQEKAVSNEGGGEGKDWTTSILLSGLWGALLYYVFKLSPNQTPSMDMYLLKKLLNLATNDGFRMNEVILSLWYIMGLWPMMYSMLLLPTGRSSKSKIPVWPFLVMSCFGGAYALIPYFILWSPPSPSVEEAELRKWPLNIFESKVTAAISLAAGLGLISYAGLADGDTWKEFYQYFRGSRFIHATGIDFALLSAFAPFWVYNDMTARKWSDKASWLLPISLIPFLGPALYVLLRPSLPARPGSPSGNLPEDK